MFLPQALFAKIEKLGGDSMDETLATQSDGVTQAKQPRVGLAQSDGSLVGPTSPAYVVSDETNEFLRQIVKLLGQLVELNGGIPCPK
jgi:hypothetical protein